MKPFRAAAALAAFLLGAAPAPATPQPAAAPDVVRVFRLKHRNAEAGFVVVRPLLTARGSIVVQPGQNTIIVRDAAAAVENAARAVASFDVPPRAFSVAVSLYRATTDRDGRSEPALPAEPSGGVGERLRKLFSFTDYAALDEVVLQGVEGDALSWPLGGGYRVDFLLEAAGRDVVRLRNLVLVRVRRDEKGRETVRDVARTSINARLREPFVLGIGREEGGSAALFLVLTASPLGPSPGIGGLR